MFLQGTAFSADVRMATSPAIKATEVQLGLELNRAMFHSLATPSASVTVGLRAVLKRAMFSTGSDTPLPGRRQRIGRGGVSDPIATAQAGS